MHLSFEERNVAEQAFFCTGRFANLPRDSVGVEALRGRLSKVLLRHLVQELPALKEEMGAKLQTTRRELDTRGQRRETPAEQRMLLMKISMDVHQILTAAVNGHYLHPFFGSADLDSPISAGSNLRRFRAVVQNLNFQFAENMRIRGHAFEFIREGSNSTNFLRPTTEDGSDDGLPSPDYLPRDEAIKWVKAMILRCRGLELPGSVNPEVTSHLFREQSAPWEDIAALHIERIADLCREFIDQVIEFAVPDEFQKQLGDINVNATLQDAVKAGKDELQKLLEDKARHPRYVWCKVAPQLLC